MNLRLAKAEDIEAIRRLETEAFGFTWGAEVFSKELQREDCLFLVGEAQSRVIASLSLNWAVDEVQVLSVVLEPAYRGKGLSHRLLGAALAYCQARGLRWVHLEVKWDNQPANRLYRRFGFTTVGRRKKYYRDGQDARVMMAGPLTEAQERLSDYRELAKPLLDSEVA